MAKAELPFNKTEFFYKLEPALEKMAQRFKSHDPAGVARSWFLDFCTIWGKIEANPDHGVRVDRATGEMEQNKERLEKNLSSYFKAWFKYSLIGSEKPPPKIPSPPNADAGPSEILVEVLDKPDIRLSALLAILKDDVATLATEPTIYSKVQKIFVESCLAHFTATQEKLNDFPIVANPESTGKRFFVPDLLSGVVAPIKAELVKRAEVEPNLLILRRLVILNDNKHDSEAVRRKLNRYIETYKGGWKKRLLVRHARKK